MTQHRECCCGPGSEIECVHSDKVFTHIEDEGGAERRQNSYRVNTSEPNQYYWGGDNVLQRAFQNSYVRTNPGQFSLTKPTSNLENEHATSGMSCMLCQHTLVMNFRRKQWHTGGYQEHNCGQGDQGPGCCKEETYCNQRLYYKWSGARAPSEESMSALYLHWKDYWYLEPGPVGVPYTWFDEGRPLNYDPPNEYSSMRGNQRFGWPPTGLQNCLFGNVAIPRPTDGNYLCNPELKRVTNPLNPYFLRNNGTDADGNAPNFDKYLRSAAYNHDGASSGDYPPELMNMYSGCSSNVNHLAPHIGSGNPQDDQGALSAAGFSSWQCYTMQANPQLRTLADFTTFANGYKYFAAICPDGFCGNIPSESARTDLYSSVVGTLYRVRLWVRADQFYLQGSNNTYAYPCTTGFGGGAGGSDFTGPCCVPHSGCYDDIGRDECEQVYGGRWRPSNYCENNWPEGGADLACCKENSGSFTCCDWAATESCGHAGCTTDNIPCSEDEPSGGPSPQGEIVAFHPPQVNTRMHTSVENGGYRPCQKQHGGPWGLVYMCAGVPVFKYELDDLVDDGLLGESQRDNLIHYWAKTWDRSIWQTEADFECGPAGQAVEALGDTGKFNAKDWREDQLEKYDTIESEFSRLYNETPENPDAPGSGVPIEFNSFSIPSSIRNYTKNNEILPAQKTNRFLLSFLISQSLSKEQVLDPGNSDQENNLANFKLSGEMSDYQLSEPKEGKTPPNTPPQAYAKGFKIDGYDPWSSEFNGETGVRLGEDREARFPLPIDFPWRTYNFRYPIEDLYVATENEYWPELPPGWASSWDPTSIPDWEKELFEVWYKNIPIYFHTTPGGWAWSGTGYGPVPRSHYCNWSGPGGYFNLNGLSSIYQIQLNTRTGGPCPGACNEPDIMKYSTTCCKTQDCLACGQECSIGSFDPFPNNFANISTDASTIIPTTELQPRDKPTTIQCRTLNPICAGCSSWGSIENTRCGMDESGFNECCPGIAVECQPLFTPPIAPPCESECGPGTNVGCCPNNCEDCIKPQRTLRNCCKSFRPYGRGFGLGGFNYLREYDAIWDSPVITSNSPAWKVAEHLKTKVPNSASSYRSGSCAGSSEGCDTNSECGPGCKCCCNQDCTLGCECVTEKTECDNGPCVGPAWSSTCCNYNGICCYEDPEDPSRRICEENISEEQCEACPNDWNCDFIYGDCSNGRCGEWRENPDGGDPLTCTVPSDGTDVGPCQAPSPQGACCYTKGADDTLTCQVMYEASCDKRGGDWSEGIECADLDPLCEDDDEPPGDYPCCYQNDDGVGGCRAVENKEECDNLGGFSCSVPCDPDDPICPDAGCWEDHQFHCCCYDSSNDTFSCRPLSDGCDELEDPNVSCQLVAGADCKEIDCYNGGDGGGGGSDCDVCGIGVNPGCFSLFNSMSAALTAVASRWNPTPDQPCRCGPHDAVDTCIIKHYQASKSSFRIVNFITTSPAGANDSVCPVTRLNSSGPCCCPQCSPSMDFSVNACPASGIEVHTVHKRKAEYVVNIYPFRLRCSQVQDINGYQRCGLLQEELEIDNPLFIDRLPRVLVGMADPLSCNSYRRVTGDGDDPPTEETCCGYNDSCSLVWNKSKTFQYYTCGEFEDACSGWATVWQDTGSTSVQTHNNPRQINHGSYCIGLGLNSQLMGKSYVHTNGKPVYLPTGFNELLGMPRLICPYKQLINTTELERPDILPKESLLRKCAEYYNDKELSKLDIGDIITSRQKTSGIVFKDYGGLKSVDGISAEFVDVDITQPDWETFWMKQDYPSLQKLRLFSVGNFQTEGGFEGGAPFRGQFAGSMVAIFTSEEERESFDNQIGFKNVKMIIGSNGIPGQPDEGEFQNRMSDCEFIGRPSYNPYWLEEDSDESAGWTGGLGLTYTNLTTGTGPWDGKVYEFCAKTNAGECALKPDPPGSDPISGIRGPVGFKSREPFNVDIYKLAGTTNQNFLCCVNDC